MLHTQLDLRKNILDTMIYVMECGCVIPVLNRIKRWTSKIDQSLLRHFVIKVLEMISPPFSNEFVHKFLDIINSLSPESLKLQETATLLASFCEHCAKMTNLSNEDMMLIETLKKFLPSQQ
jgi:hypothetical protein